MIEIHAVASASTTVPPSAEIIGYLTLPYELRQKSRLRTALDDGTEIGLFLSRGTVLRHGDLLSTSEGDMIEVRAALEKVSTIFSHDPLLLMRAAYHLGNRHVPLQINADSLRYRHDHVLDDMLRQLGLTVNVEQAPFEPESGAYGGQHAHTHSHVHAEHD